MSEYLRSSLPAVDHRSFFSAVRDGWKEWLDRQAVPAEIRPLYVPFGTPELLGQFDKRFVAIVYRVAGSEMAGTSPDGTRRRPKGILLRETLDHPGKAGYLLQIFGWWELLHAEFTIWAKTSADADAWCWEFHRAMMVLAHDQYFRARGVEDFRFVSRGRDQIRNDLGTDLHVRELVYQARIELLTWREIKTVDLLRVRVAGPGGFEQEFRTDTYSDESKD